MPIATLGAEYLQDTINQLTKIPSKNLRPLLWSKRSCSKVDFDSLPYLQVKFRDFFLFAFTSYFYQKSANDTRRFFDFPVSYGFNRILAVEMAPRDRSGLTNMKFFLDESTSPSEVRALECLLYRMPAFSEFSQEQSNMRSKEANWVIKTSVTAVGIPVPKDSTNYLQELYDKDLFGKDVSKVSIIFEAQGRQPSAKKKRLPLAFSFKIPYDPFIKAYLIHTTFNECIRLKWALHGYFYRIIIRSNEKEKMIQLIWVLSEEFMIMEEATARDIMNEAAIKFRVWLKCVLQKLPDSPPILITLNPYQLKNEKPVANLPGLAEDDFLESFIDTSVSLDKSGLGRPVQQAAVSEKDTAKNISAPAAASEPPAPYPDHSDLTVTVPEPECNKEPLLVEAEMPVAQQESASSEVDSLIGKDYHLHLSTLQNGWVLLGHYDILKYHIKFSSLY
jgi:hypothetical protein